MMPARCFPSSQVGSVRSRSSQDEFRGPCVAQWVKDPVLSLLWLGYQSLACPQPKKKKPKKKPKKTMDLRPGLKDPTGLLNGTQHRTWLGFVSKRSKRHSI